MSDPARRAGKAKKFSFSGADGGRKPLAVFAEFDRIRTTEQSLFHLKLYEEDPI
jgi:hypothetical protein